MALFTYPFDFNEGDIHQVSGKVELGEPLPDHSRGGGFYRPGKILVDGCKPLELVLYHNPATAAFIYLRNCLPDANLLETAGLSPPRSTFQKRSLSPGSSASVLSAQD